MLLLVGLGNPGKEYAENRHNIGAMAINEIIRHHSFSSSRTRSRPKGVFSEGMIEEIKAVTLKPLTYMNESGQAVGAALRYWNLETDQIFVIHDELDLAPGTVRAKLGGGDAGHNGLRSITSHIGANYWRIRLGIGHPGEKTRVTGHVLHDFTKADKVWVARTVEAVAKTIPLLLSGDATAFSTQITLLTQPHTTN
ncbi:MAG: aminoacyl-tRNA hydrolase [Pseudomonadota bacterium]|nr:aminoacyl-tRNA hydrolase [Pseudomonadota bacterium]